jgi:stress-induced morphogen
MPVTREELEAAIRAAIQVTHVNVEDNSGGCGEKYSVLIVSKVLFFSLNSDGRTDSNDWTMDGLPGLRRQDDAGTAQDWYYIFTTCFSCPHLYQYKPSAVNEVLKTQIAQIHAFTQVCSLSRRFLLIADIGDTWRKH